MMRAKLKAYILRALKQMDGTPLTERALIDSVRLAFGEVLLTEIQDAKRALEAEGFIAGQRDDALETITWTLTTKGKHKASEL
jgi:hypothetical protein